MYKRNRKTTFNFINISKDLRRIVANKAYAIYGKPLPQEIQERLNIEVNSIIENRLDILYMITSKLVEKSKKYGYLTGYRGCLGSSLVAYLLGITECNPLPKKYGGFNIPFETFAGVNFNKYLDINLNIATDIYKKICKYLDQLLKEHKICTNYGGIKVINGIYSFKRNIAKMTGEQIGNIVLLSDDNQVYLKKLYDLTNINPKAINLNNVCMSDFTIASKICFDKETEIIKKIIQKTQANTFEDLIRVLNLIYGTETWKDNAETIISNGEADLLQVITSRDDIMIYLMEKGIDRITAYNTMENVRKGKGLTSDMTNIMIKHDIPYWYISSCNKIKYLFPKAHAISYLLCFSRLAWYETNYNKEFNKLMKKSLKE